MIVLSITLMDAGISMALKPRRLPVSVSSASANSLRIPVTTTCSSNSAAGRRRSRRIGGPATTVTRDVSGANPSWSTVSVYSPAGISSMTKVPSVSVVAASPSSSRVTEAPANAAPPASSTTVPCTAPSPCPSAGRAWSRPSPATIATSTPILRHARSPSVRVDEINLRSFRRRKSIHKIGTAQNAGQLKFCLSLPEPDPDGAFRTPDRPGRSVAAVAHGLSGTGWPRRPITRARSSRRRWRTWSRTRSRRPTPGRTCLSAGGG